MRDRPFPKGCRVKVVRAENPNGSAHRFLNREGVVTIDGSWDDCMVSIDNELGADQVYFWWTELERTNG